MDSFIETPRFDDVISYGSTGGPSFDTFIFEGDSGLEGIVPHWDAVKCVYNIEQSIRDKDDFDVVRAFFYNTYGRARGFRFKDHFDFTGTDEPCIGIVNGVNDTFRLVKRYTVGELNFDRRIFKPVQGTVTARVNGSPVTINSTDTTTGTIVLSTPPTEGSVVTASFQFDVPVRFDIDQLSASYEGFQLQNCSNLPLVELILED